MVLAQLEINPDISLKDCQKVVKGLKKDNFYKIKRESKPKKNKRNKQKRSDSIQGKTTIPPLLTPDGSDHPDYIDDPDELLMSVAKRMLNMSNPDPRWATILLNCRKENLTNKNELTEQLSKANTKSLVGLLRKNSPVEQE